jgi:hypothetical protein
MSKPPITSWEDLRRAAFNNGVNKGKGVTIRNGSVHEVDASDADHLELGGRVEEELN